MPRPLKFRLITALLKFGAALAGDLIVAGIAFTSFADAATRRYFFSILIAAVLVLVAHRVTMAAFGEVRSAVRQAQEWYRSLPSSARRFLWERAGRWAFLCLGTMAALAGLGYAQSACFSGSAQALFVTLHVCAQIGIGLGAVASWRDFVGWERTARKRCMR